MLKLAVGFRVGLFATRMNPLEPLQLNALPTCPAAYAMLSTTTPWLVPVVSRALASARHQLTKPDGGGVQGGLAGSTWASATPTAALNTVAVLTMMRIRLRKETIERRPV